MIPKPDNASPKIKNPGIFNFLILFFSAVKKCNESEKLKKAGGKDLRYFANVVFEN